MMEYFFMTLNLCGVLSIFLMANKTPILIPTYWHGSCFFFYYKIAQLRIYS